MDMVQLQTALKSSNRYFGPTDGKYGPLTKAGVLLALTDGPDTRLSDADFQESAARLGVPVACVKAVTAVESNGGGFLGGRALILPEPHVFSRLTKHRFDAQYPKLSYAKWDRKKYPKTQDLRYDQLLGMIGLDVDAGFSCPSYGLFQILGCNYQACGFDSPYAFAVAQARDEETQLMSFEKFLSSSGLITPLKKLNWAGFAKGYNGPSYRDNKYDERLAAAYQKFV